MAAKPKEEEEEPEADFGAEEGQEADVGIEEEQEVDFGSAEEGEQEPDFGVADEQEAGFDAESLPADSDESLGPELEPVKFVQAEDNGGSDAEAAVPEPQIAANDTEVPLDEEQISAIYGKGSELLLQNGHILRMGLPHSDVATCLRASKQYSLGRGLGFSPPKGPVGEDEVWKRGVRAPVCTSCKQQRWPAWRSKKGCWHCGFCHRPDGGRPRCHRCSAITWDGWSGPLAHNRM